MCTRACLHTNTYTQAEIRCDNPNECISSPIVSDALKSDVEVMLKAANTQQQGFIMWVRHDYVNDFYDSIVPLLPQMLESSSSTEHSLDFTYASEHRNEYLELIKRIIGEKDSVAVETEDVHSLSRAEMFALCVRSSKQRKRDREAEKEKTLQSSSAARMCACARMVLGLVYPERFIVMSHDDSKFSFLFYIY